MLFDLDGAMPANLSLEWNNYDTGLKAVLKIDEIQIVSETTLTLKNRSLKPIDPTLEISVDISQIRMKLKDKGKSKSGELLI